jgi:predicted DNA-binding transcriptional regulator YafY
MRADRLLSILLLLQANRRMTARDLSARLEVSERTIHRDMESLSAAGVPVYAQRGNGGGWLLPEAYRTTATGLTGAEIQALFAGRPPRVLADLGLHQAAEAALVKLLAELPAVSRRDAEDARQRLHVDSTGWRRPEEAVPFLPAIQAAVWQERRLRIEYQRPGDSTVERTLDPLGLVAKGSLWYLVAAVDGAPRTYRVSRVRSATLLDEPCVRPPDFDLAAYWSQSSAQFVAALPRYPLTVRAAPDALPRATGPAGYVRLETTGATDADGWTTLHLCADTEEEACGFVLSFGTRMEVLEPPELRERVAQLAASVAAFYVR